MNFNKLIPELSVLVAVFCSNSRASNPVVKSKEVLLMLQQGSIPIINGLASGKCGFTT
ncbi:hypothetical protein EFK13_03000 [Bacillus cabrialesii]|uniref:hypothetical protein n=1 Tax=Bacillus cabrialesii TaxID=2487276 RepID=UPI000A992036|nr:hypothetical protein [Bacillus cabrialesii]UQE79620.1 hypothetical protein EFK13_03000 [Bacillus cabrialesii]